MESVVMEAPHREIMRTFALIGHRGYGLRLYQKLLLLCFCFAFALLDL